jgi:hypothetical protein
MPILVFACYRPKRGKESELRQCVRDHLPTLLELGLVTERAPIIGTARDGTIVEIFEWESREAIDRAHSNPIVQAMWGRFSECCEFVPVGTIPGSSELFMELAPVVFD